MHDGSGQGSRVWDGAPWPPCPSLAGDHDVDVCVIGAGGSGLACAEALVEQGQRVIELDADAVASGAAGSNGGFLLAGLPSFHHDAVRGIGVERATAIYRLTIAEIERMARETPTLVRRCGSLRIADSAAEAEDCTTQFESMRASNLAVERYAGPEGHGLLIPTDGAFQPLARCRALASSLLARGGRIFERSPAVEIASGSVSTPDGRVTCQHVVVAVDGGLERLLPELEGRVRSARLQMLATAPATDVTIPRPVYIRWGFDYWQQLPDGRIAMGGARDLAGESEWTCDRSPTTDVQERLEATLRTRVETSAPVVHRWAATVGFTRDHMPVAGQLRPGVWALGGYSGTGNVLGALLGRAVAEAIVHGHSPTLAYFATGSLGISVARAC